MNDERFRKKPPNDEASPFELFERLARRIVAVPKSEIEDLEDDEPELDEELAPAET